MESTQILARRLADAGAAEGTVVLAREQTGGRGRLGASFYSPPGGLYLSVVLRPWLPPDQTPLIGLAAGVAVARAARELAAVETVLKWPNDVLVGGRKLSGILVEMGAGAGVLGIGLNVNLSASDFPGELRAIATSLALATGRQFDLDAALSVLLAHLDAAYANAAGAVDAWRAEPNILGQNVRISSEKEDVEGLAESLDTTGALLLRLADGSARRLLSGEVHLRTG